MIKKSDLNLVPTASSVLLTPPVKFDFSGDIDSELLTNLMLQRMKELGGIGLSANQVGLNIRMFVMGVGDVTYSIFNPEIIKQSTNEISLDEGCLSFPGIFVKVKRPDEVTVRYQTPKGEYKEETFHGLTCRVFLHEFDHMEGITFNKRVSQIKWNLASNRLQKRIKKVVKKHVRKKLVDIKNELDMKARQ